MNLPNGSILLYRTRRVKMTPQIQRPSLSLVIFNISKIVERAITRPSQLCLLSPSLSLARPRFRPELLSVSPFVASSHSELICKHLGMTSGVS